MAKKTIFSRKSHYSSRIIEFFLPCTHKGSCITDNTKLTEEKNNRQGPHCIGLLRDHWITIRYRSNLMRARTFLTTL